MFHNADKVEWFVSMKLGYWEHWKLRIFQKKITSENIWMHEKLSNRSSFEVLMVVSTKMAVFWVVALCSLV
jgi:hypothetical protein